MESTETHQSAGRILYPAIIVTIIVILDQVTKVLARQSLAQKPATGYLGNTFWLIFTQNSGAFLGMGAALSATVRFLIFVVFVVAVLVALFYFIYHSQQVDRLLLVALSVVAGGGIGNLIDRVLFHGEVTDFMLIKVWILQTGVFNLADLAIMVGIALILITSFKGSSTHA